MRLSLKGNRLDFLTEEISKQHGIQVTAQLLLDAFSHAYSKNWRCKQSRKKKNLKLSRKRMCLKVRSRKKQLLKRFMWCYVQENTNSTDWTPLFMKRVYEVIRGHDVGNGRS